MSHFVMGIKYGASDTTSGIAANPVIGYVADKVIDMGGTVMFGETTEFIGAEHILQRRAKNETVAKDITRIVTEMENRVKAIGVDMRRGQPTPGNIKGEGVMMKRQFLLPDPGEGLTNEYQRFSARV